MKIEWLVLILENKRSFDDDDMAKFGSSSLVTVVTVKVTEINVDPKIAIEKLREFFAKDQGDLSDLDEHDNLFENGILSSLKVVSLILFLEQQFSCELEFDELTEGNLGSLSSIVKMLQIKNIVLS